MLSVEIIGLLGVLLAVLVYAMVRTQLARKQAEAEESATKGVSAATEKTG